jgi:hypothetical protein
MWSKTKEGRGAATTMRPTTTKVQDDEDDLRAVCLVRAIANSL